MSLKALKVVMEEVARNGVLTFEERHAARKSLRAIERAAQALNNDEVRRALRHAPDDVQEALSTLEIIAKEAD